MHMSIGNECQYRDVFLGIGVSAALFGSQNGLVLKLGVPLLSVPIRGKSGRDNVLVSEGRWNGVDRVDSFSMG